MGERADGSLIKIDLNLDAGEMESALADGSEEQLYSLVTSVNVACGGHAGTLETMSQSVELAKKHGCAIGAHPSYPDLASFGRVSMSLALPELKRSLQTQILSLQKVASQKGVALTHVKPHGALYNDAARDLGLADVIAESVAEISTELILVGLAGSQMRAAAERRKLAFAAEGFVDRKYERDGSLRSRRHSDAVLTDPEEVVSQAVRLARAEPIKSATGEPVLVSAQTLCLHGDHPNALAVARRVRQGLTENGITIRAIAKR